MKQKIVNKLKTFNYLYFINVISLAGTLGSLYFSEAEELSPCNLCWYQRVFLYPIAFISTWAIIKKDTKIFSYFIVLAIPGAILGLYQYLLQKTDWFTSGLSVCSPNNPCSEIDWEILGFVTIPFLSMLAFITVIVLSVLAIRINKGKI